MTETMSPEALADHGTTEAEAFFAGIAPRDSVEEMLAKQMVACHRAALACLPDAGAATAEEGPAPASLDQALRAMSLFARQADTLARHRARARAETEAERSTRRAAAYARFNAAREAENPLAKRADRTLADELAKILAAHGLSSQRGGPAEGAVEVAGARAEAAPAEDETPTLRETPAPRHSAPDGDESPASGMETADGAQGLDSAAVVAPEKTPSAAPDPPTLNRQQRRALQRQERRARQPAPT